MIWLLWAALLVMFMQAGFAMVETGLCRAKNAAHTISMTLMIYPLACLAFWAYGFALGWGNSASTLAWPGSYATIAPSPELKHGGGFSPVVDMASGKATGEFRFGLIGLRGFFLSGLEDPGSLALFFVMMVLLGTAATIPTGAMAERWRWKNFCLYGLWAAIPYGIYANWVWGGGWLARAGLNWDLGHGAVDFAGSGVVHAMGGLIGLVGAATLGPRISKYRNGKPMPIPGHHVPMVVVGTFVLAFGCFGFNAGSCIADAGLPGSDLTVSGVAVNTLLAGAAGAITAMLSLWAKRMKPDPTLMCNGLLAGLVAITAPCAFVDSWAAALIGAIAGVAVVVSVFAWEKIGIDDPVGAISIHGVNGLWGLVAVGVFANGKHGAGWNGVVRDGMVSKYGSDGVRGILYSDASQLVAQLLSAGVLIVFAVVMAYAWFKLSNLITPIRVARETELEGLDLPAMGAMGYPDFTVAKR